MLGVLTVRRTMSAMKTWIRCLTAFATVCLLLKEAATESLEIRTKICTRHRGGPLEILGKYISTPGGPVEWQRPDSTTIGICTPSGSCNLYQTGYSVSQSASGLDYTLLISAAESIDEGIWRLLDGANPLSTSLTFAENLSAVDVNCSVTNTSDGYTESVTCTTECVNYALNVSYTFQDRLLTPPTNSTRCASGAHYTSTVTFNSIHSGGSYELCYVLFNGDCSYTQPDPCQTVVIRNLSAVNVNCSVTNTSDGYTESVTCTTECVDDILNVSYTIQDELLTPPTHATSCASGAEYSSTVAFNSSHFSGRCKLRYVLFNGVSNYTQVDPCQTVVIPNKTVPCWVFIVFLGLAGVLFVACIILLTYVKKQKITDQRRNVVIGTLIAALVLAVLAVTFLIVSLVNTECDVECRNLRNSDLAQQLGIAGIVSTALGLIAFIAAVIIYYCVE